MDRTYRTDSSTQRIKFVLKDKVSLIHGQKEIGEKNRQYRKMMIEQTERNIRCRLNRKERGSMGQLMFPSQFRTPKKKFAPSSYDNYSSSTSLVR